MKIAVNAFWDEATEAWIAVARSGLNLATEAASVEELQRRLADLVADLLPKAADEAHEIELILDGYRRGAA